MKRLAAILLLTLPLFAKSPHPLEAGLRRLTQENLDAIAPGRAEVWRRNLHEKMTHVDENGAVRTKAELLAEFQPLPKGLVGRLEITKFQVVREGDVAIATHEDLEHLDSGTAASMVSRKCRNSMLRCRRWHSPITLPVTRSSAAKREVVPYRA